MAFLFVYPFVFNLSLSFYKLNLFQSKDSYFVGLDNYVNAMSSPFFLTALKNTLFFTFLSTGLEFLGGLFLAILLSRIKQGRTIFTTLLMIPLMIATVVGAETWRFMYSPGNGIINYVLGTQIQWLADANIAVYSIIFADAWKNAPFFMIVFLAGLLSIPNEQFEAIRIDGASFLQEFRWLIVPRLLPLFVIATAIRMIDAFTKVFDIVYILTSGGPGNATDMIPLQIFKTTFAAFRWGEAATLSMITFAISLVFTVVYIRVVERR